MVARPFQRVQWPVPRDLIGGICASIATTGAPEDVAAPHPGPIAKGEPFLIVRELSIPRGRRADGRMAPCPMCQPNKFIEGRLVWFSALEALAVIGHCCADRVTRLAAEREFRAREAKARAEDYLLATLPGLPAIRAEQAALAPRVAAAHKLHREFRHSGAAFQRALRQATRNGGMLTVAEVLGPRMAGGPAGVRTAGSTVETRDVSFGMLSGMSMVAANCRLADKFAGTVTSLAALPEIDDEDAALAWLVQLDDKTFVARERNLRSIVNGLAQVAADLEDFVRFFSVANAGRITAWGSHRDAPVPMRAGCKFSRVAGHVEFEIIGGQGRRAGLTTMASPLDLP